MTVSKKDLLADAVLLLVLGIIVLGLGLLMRPSLARIWRALHLPAFRSEAVAVGTAADYEWEVTTLEGKTVPVSSFKGKVVFLNFWATWCGPCKMEMPSIGRLYDQFKQKDIVFLLVSDESPAAVAAFVQKSGLQAPVYTVAKVPPSMKVVALPATLILSRNGTVALSHLGARLWDRSATVELLTKLLDEKGGGKPGTAGEPGAAANPERQQREL